MPYSSFSPRISDEIKTPNHLPIPDIKSTLVAGGVLDVECSDREQSIGVPVLHFAIH